MADKITIKLPFPPSVNAYWRYTKLPKMKVAMPMISKEGRAYQKTILDIVFSHRLIGTFPDEMVDVKITLFPKDRRRRDIDNYTKCLFDSLSKAKFWGDDKQVGRLTIEKSETKGGYILMTVEAMEPIIHDPQSTLI